MAVVELVKIGILSTKPDTEKVMEVLYNFGVVEIINNIDQSETNPVEFDNLSQIEYKLAQLKFALGFISRHKPEIKQSFKQKLEKIGDQGIKIKPEKIKKLMEDSDYLGLITKIEELEGKINSTLIKINQNENEIKEFLPWKDLLSIYQADASERIQAKIGIISQLDWEEIKNSSDSKKDLLALAPIDESKPEVKLAIVYLKDSQKEINDYLNSFGFKEVILPDYSAVPRDLINSKTTELKSLEQEKKQLLQAAEDLANSEKDLQIIYDYLSWQRDKQAARLQAQESQATFYLQGWVPKLGLEDLETLLKEKTNNIHITELELEEDEEPPVVLKNKSLIKPFESVTNVYGAPKYFELDPTPYLAPFFILFYGICLSDAGYGLLLALLSWGAIKLMKIPKAKQDLFRLLIFAGIATFIVGILFGGYFGIVIDDLPAGVIKTILLNARIIDPVKSPLIMLGFALILGMMQVLAGLMINMYYQFTKRDWGNTLDSGAWLFLMLAFISWLVAGQVLDNATLVTAAKYWIYLSLILVVLIKGRNTKNIFLKLPIGILGLYDIVGYFSDIMSYSRLLALGLSTGIIAMVINIVAFLFKDMIPFVGWPVAIAILLGGHLFNLAINALGSFIHSGRLQYVEFFPKFMEGGGARFKPLAKTAKYIDIYD